MTIRVKGFVLKPNNDRMIPAPRARLQKIVEELRTPDSSKAEWFDYDHPYQSCDRLADRLAACLAAEGEEEPPCGRAPLAEHWQPSYQAQRRRLEPVYQGRQP